MQSPGGARDDVADALGVTPEEMTVHVTLLGGGFGRKSKCDFAIEAALLSKEMGGTPVKVVWTREDDIRHGFYHTVTAERIEAGARRQQQGDRLAASQRGAVDHVRPSRRTRSHPVDIELGMGWVDTPFDVPNIRMESGEAQSHVRIGWFRSRQQRGARLVDPVVRRRDWRAQLGKDPKDFLLELIGPDRIVDPTQAGDDAVVELRRAIRDLSRSTPGGCAG